MTSKTESLRAVAEQVLREVSSKGGYYKLYDAAKAALALPDETPAPQNYHCRLCGGDVTFPEGARPSASAGPGNKKDVIPGWCNDCMKPKHECECSRVKAPERQPGPYERTTDIALAAFVERWEHVPASAADQQWVNGYARALQAVRTNSVPSPVKTGGAG
jgi:hypothetical protein